MNFINFFDNKYFKIFILLILLFLIPFYFNNEKESLTNTNISLFCLDEPNNYTYSMANIMIDVKVQVENYSIKYYKLFNTYKRSRYKKIPLGFFETLNTLKIFKIKNKPSELNFYNIINIKKIFMNHDTQNINNKNIIYKHKYNDKSETLNYIIIKKEYITDLIRYLYTQNTLSMFSSLLIIKSIKQFFLLHFSDDNPFYETELQDFKYDIKFKNLFKINNFKKFYASFIYYLLNLLSYIVVIGIVLIILLFYYILSIKLKFNKITKKNEKLCYDIFKNLLIIITGVYNLKSIIQLFILFKTNTKNIKNNNIETIKKYFNNIEQELIQKINKYNKKENMIIRTSTTSENNCILYKTNIEYKEIFNKQYIAARDKKIKNMLERKKTIFLLKKTHSLYIIIILIIDLILNIYIKNKEDIFRLFIQKNFIIIFFFHLIIINDIIVFTIEFFKYILYKYV